MYKATIRPSKSFVVIKHEKNPIIASGGKRDEIDNDENHIFKRSCGSLQTRVNNKNFSICVLYGEIVGLKWAHGKLLIKRKLS